MSRETTVQTISVRPGPAHGLARTYAPPLPPPARPGIGGLGVLNALRRNGYSAFPARCLDEPVVRLRLPWGDLVIASGAEAIGQVLHGNAEGYARLAAGRRILGPIVGRGLLTAEGAAWRRQRKMMAPAFTPRTVPVLAAHIMRCGETTCAALAADDGPVDLLAAMQALALEIGAVSMFSLESASFDAEMRAMVTSYMRGVGRPRPSDFLLPPGVPTPIAARRRAFRRRWTRLIDAVIAQRRTQEPAEDARDLFDLMAAALGEGEDDLLRDEVSTMIVAGHETTALSLFWACLMLAHAPAWQDAIADEARGLDLSPERAADSLPRLAVTRAVVRETMRLYPPAFMSARRAVRPDTLGGLGIPAGAMVLLPLFLLHRDPRLWTEPDTFDPARFLDGPEPGRFDYLPFGAGPNTCIGAQLAMTEAVLVLARLFRDSTLRLDDTRPVLPIGVIATRPDRAPRFRLAKRRDA